MSGKGDVTWCKLCGNDSSGIKSHILPKQFIRLMKGPSNKEKLTLIDLQAKKEYGAQDWFYEYGLLCKFCENRIGKYESAYSYFYKEQLKNEAEPKAQYSLQVDYKSIRLFNIANIYRCSVSTRPEFADFDIAPMHLNRFKQMLLNDDPGSDFTYPMICLQTVEDGKKTVGAVVAPSIIKLKDEFDLLVVILVYGGTEWYVLVDGNMPSSDLLGGSLKESGSLTVRVHDFYTSPTIERLIQSNLDFWKTKAVL